MEYLAEISFDPEYGARPLKRAVMRYIEDPVSEFIISDRILVSRNKNQGEIRTLKVGISPDKESTVVELSISEPRK